MNFLQQIQIFMLLPYFTKDGDSFYQFIYYADPEFFSKNFSNFQKLIEIMEFASQKKI
jgi:hypothetical protein